MEWFAIRDEEEWNQPNRTDHYLMQIAYYLVLCHLPKLIGDGGKTLQDFAIPFKTALPEDQEPEDETPREITDEEADRLTEQSRAIWFSRVGKADGSQRRDSEPSSQDQR